MELDFRKKSRRDRMMRSKNFDTQEGRETGRKEAGESRGFPILWMGNQHYLAESVKYFLGTLMTLTNAQPQ